MNDRSSSTRVLVLTEVPRRDPGGTGDTISRRRALHDLAEADVKVDADSGGKLLVIEASDAEVAKIERQIPGVKVVDLERGFDDRLEDLDEQDALFARAMAIRVSPEYRELKRKQKPGETPEEQLLLTGPCTPPED